MHFPAGKWYDLYTDAVQAGGQQSVVELSVSKLPVFVKESSIVPMQSLVQSTSEKPADTLAIHIYKGDVNNSVTYYEDDGASFAYEKGAYYKRAITYDAQARRIQFGAVEGSYKSKFSKLEIVLHGFGDVPSLKTVTRMHAFLDEAGGQATVRSATMNNDSGSFAIGY